MNSASCTHCGLPAPPHRRGAEGPTYCCGGCAVAAAVLAASREGASAEERSRSLLLRLGLAAFFSADVMVLSLCLYSGTALPPVALALIRGLLLGLSIPAFAILAPPYVVGLVKSARRARFSTDGLIGLGASCAFLFSAANVLRGTGEVYFDTATMVLLLVTVGRLLEANSRVRGRRAVALLLTLKPPEARVWREREWHSAPAADVHAGDCVRVLAGERVPVDGRILRGAAAVDESALTGEALPAARTEGDTVRAGSLCLDGLLEIEVEGEASGFLLNRIVRSVEEAQQARSPLESLADRISAVLVPATVLLAGLTAVWWWRASPQKALLNALSVLVVACPCALGIALPLVYVVALGVAARRGVLVRSAEAFERLARIDTVAFDKTGTLTAGRIEVTAVAPAAGVSEESLLRAAAAASAASRHPASRAVLEFATGRGIAPLPVRRAEEAPGRGVRAELDDGQCVLLGAPRWAGWADASHSVICSSGGALMGGFSISDPVTPAARTAVAALRARGFRLVMLSGDRPEAVAEAARNLGIEEARGGLLPHEKAARIAEWRRRRRAVAMVGDGINDAPALAAADVGVAVSGGADVARETAQVVLLEPSLGRVPELLSLARLTRRMAFENLGWAAGYNTVALALAATGHLKPLWAAVLMVASSLFVVGNALRLPARAARRTV